MDPQTILNTFHRSKNSIRNTFSVGRRLFFKRRPISAAQAPRRAFLPGNYLKTHGQMAFLPV